MAINAEVLADAMIGYAMDGDLACLLRCLIFLPEKEKNALRLLIMNVDMVLGIEKIKT